MAEVLFEWDEANLEHLEKHGFSREDAEAAIIDPKRVSSFAKQDGAAKGVSVWSAGARVGASYTLFLLFVTGEFGPFIFARPTLWRKGGTGGESNGEQTRKN